MQYWSCNSPQERYNSRESVPKKEIPVYNNGEGVTLDYAEARSLFEKACSGGAMSGCTSLGILYANGMGVSKDKAQSRALYKKCCDGGFQLACTNLRKLH